jgi:LuxR family maltose regulon positive regulatory protein
LADQSVVWRFQARTSVLERVSGPLADLLTGGSGGERILQKLEQAGAFVVALDARRSWFRYHRLFADLLELELRHNEPAELATLHGTAADWFAEHGFGVEAVRHAQATQDWELAGRLLADHWLDVTLDGQAATAYQLVRARAHPRQPVPGIASGMADRGFAAGGERPGSAR